MSDQKGMTLIELIAVVMIISAVFFMVTVKLDNRLPTDKMNEVSRQIINTVSLLREKAMTEQKQYVFHLDPGANSVWITNRLMSEDEIRRSYEKRYQLPQDVRVVGVAYPDGEKVVSERADIYFYQQGYSDKALIYLEGEKDQQFSFLIEPFLPQVKLYERHIEFDGRPSFF